MMRVFLNGNKEFIDIPLVQSEFILFMNQFHALCNEFSLPEVIVLAQKIYHAKDDKDKLAMLEFSEVGSGLYNKVTFLSKVIGIGNFNILCNSLYSYYASKVKHFLYNLSDEQKDKLVNSVRKDYEEFENTAVDRSILNGTYKNREQAVNDYITYLQEYGG